MKFLKKYKIFEGTSGYFPGYSCDTVADYMSSINDKTSKVMNRELEKIEKKWLDTTDSELFWNKWTFSTLVMTAVQDGYKVNREIVKRISKYYKDILKDPNITNYLENSYKLFKTTIEATSILVSNIISTTNKKDYIYYPGFMDSNDELRNRIESKFKDNYKLKYYKDLIKAIENDDPKPVSTRGREDAKILDFKNYLKK